MAEHPPPRDLEYELGVPFPGRLLPAAAWTRTGLKVLPVPFDWVAVFGRDGPRVADLGCGNGRSTIHLALARPGHLHLGLDTLQVAIDHAARRANRRGLANVRFAVAEAAAWLATGATEGSLDELHVYHPQPYYEADAAGRRLFTPGFLARAHAVLRPGGLLVVQTDNRAYWRYLTAALAKHFEPRTLEGPWPDAPEGRSRRELQSRRKGLAIWRMEARRRDQPLPLEIPSPDFDADRPRFRRARRRRRPAGGPPPAPRA